jgi:hypothetical protein
MLSNADGASVRRTAPELILPDAGLSTGSKHRRTAPELILPDAGIKGLLKVVRN